MLSGLLASSGGSRAWAQATSPSPPAGQGLHSLFVASGKLFFGTATDTNNINDVPYQAIATNQSEFGMIVPENSQKWEAVQPTLRQFVYNNSDVVASRAKANRQLFRCHTLTWHSQLPQFVSTTSWTRATLTAAIQAHIANVVGHFKGQCYSWDVVNEALADNGTFRNDVFLQTLGTDYLGISFTAAAAADPDTKLYYNDFNLETIKAKADGAVAIVKILQSANVRIDGVGFQAHFNVGQTPNKTSLVATMERFTSLGLDVTLSELDIAHTKLPATPSALEQQSRDYVSAVDACLAVPKCVGITVWQFTDKYSWIPSTFPGKGDACLFTANYTKKPAYFAVSNLLVQAAAAQVQAGGTSAPASASPTVATTSSPTSFTQGSGTAAASPLPTSGAHSLLEAITAKGLGNFLLPLVGVVFLAL